MALPIYIILLHALALVFVTNAIPLLSSNVGESEAFAARQARQIVQETGITVALTVVGWVFMRLTADVHGSVNREFESVPFGIMEYYADLGNGDLLLLMSDLQVNVRNALKFPFVSFTLRVSDDSKHQNGRYPMENPRLTLLGKLNRLPDSKYEEAYEQFTAVHRDAQWWAPKDKNTGGGFHDFHYYTLKVSGLYVIDGFGGAHYVGWMNETLYHHPNQIQGPFVKQQTFWYDTV
ncbi:hypothetical protein NQZ79_g2093 [Umbelopsis isabellina]|nr:hypothetical protein NQZ79_g2093 [Umbelopsis isabellina]